MTFTSREQAGGASISIWFNPRALAQPYNRQGLFELSSRSPKHLAGILQARYGLSSLSERLAAFRSDPGVEVHPDRTAVSADGFDRCATRAPKAPVTQGWLLIERHRDGGGPEVYMRIRSFNSQQGAMAEFTARIELCAVGSLAVAERTTQSADLELHFEGPDRVVSLVCV
jgi:hypothetical protein